MKILNLSNLHLEDGGFLPEHPLNEDVIARAGDLAPYTEGLVDRLREHSLSAPYNLYVLGNHENCGTEIGETRMRFAEECADAEIHVLDPGTARLQGIRFIGATPWTDLLLEGESDEVGAHLPVRRETSDFRAAWPGGRRSYGIQHEIRVRRP